MKYRDVEDTGIEYEGIQTFDFPDGSKRTLPVYVCGAFISTPEGNNLFAQCQRSGDCGPFYQAKAAFYAQHTARVDAILGGKQA